MLDYSSCVLRCEHRRVHSTVAECVQCDTDGGLQLLLTGCFTAAFETRFHSGPMESYNYRLLLCVVSE